MTKYSKLILPLCNPCVKITSVLKKIRFLGWFHLNFIVWDKNFVFTLKYFSLLIFFLSIFFNETKTYVLQNICLHCSPVAWLSLSVRIIWVCALCWSTLAMTSLDWWSLKLETSHLICLLLYMLWFYFLLGLSYISLWVVW